MEEKNLVTGVIVKEHPFLMIARLLRYRGYEVGCEDLEINPYWGIFGKWDDHVYAVKPEFNSRPHLRIGIPAQGKKNKVEQLFYLDCTRVDGSGRAEIRCSRVDANSATEVAKTLKEGMDLTVDVLIVTEFDKHNIYTKK